MTSTPHQTATSVPCAPSTSSGDLALSAGPGAIFTLDSGQSRSPEKLNNGCIIDVDVGGVGGCKINLLKRKADVLSHSLDNDDDNAIAKSLPR